MTKPLFDRSIRCPSKALLLSLGLLVGCGGSKTEGTGGAGGASAASSTAASSSASMGGSASSSGGTGGGSGAGGGGGGGGNAVGATTPFTSYEAEAGTPGGGATIVALTKPPADQFASPELESSGHAYVGLGGDGQFVEWVNKTGKSITALNVRVSIPDAPNGGGIDATLDLYIDGVLRQALDLNSHQTWGYEGNNHYNNESQSPADGNPRTFFDEAHAFLKGNALPPGGKIRLQKDAANKAAFYNVDVIDLETPPSASAQPQGSLSITDYGAVNDKNTDSAKGIQDCIDAAQQQGKSVWIPPGTYSMTPTAELHAKGITIEGAGMWYSVIYRLGASQAMPLGPVFNLTSCTVKNFAVDSGAPFRSAAGGAMDTTGTNWVADSIWTQHTLSGFWASGTGGIVQNCRLTSIWADGCNVNNVSLGGPVGNDLTVRNNFVRGTGDDAIAINSVDYNGNTTYMPMANIKVENNTSIAPWGGKGIGIYGGSGHLVQNNYMSDTARYIGLGVGKFGVNGSDLLSGTVQGNTVVRCGGNAYVQGQPALHIGNGGDGQNVGKVANVHVTKNIVLDALYNGVAFSTANDIILDENTIDAPGLDGIVISPPFYPAPMGSATIKNNNVVNLLPGRQAFVNNSPGFVVTP